MIIAIWRGNGILVPVFFVFFMVMAVVSSKAILGGAPNHYGHYFYALATTLAALSVWFAGRASNSKAPRELIDKKTGQIVLFQEKHTFFFIKAEYWAFPLGLLAIFYLFTPATST